MHNIEPEDIERFLEHAYEHRPYEEYPEYWKTEAAYWAWLRGRLRQLWQKWPPRNALKMSKRVKAPVLDEYGNQVRYKTGRRKGQLKTRFELPCENCGGVFPQAQVEADHIETAGSCSNAVEAATFLYRLLVSAEKLRLICKPCHKIITYAERMGISFEEAKKKKLIIELLKKSVDFQKQELLGYGFKENEITNKKRREAVYTSLVEREYKL